MRVAGWIVLIAGALLCATLVWATIGFLLMGIGLLSLLAAENKRKRAGSLEANIARAKRPVASPPPAAPRPTILEPPLIDRREPPMGISAPAPPPYDMQAWQQLVENDPDLARIAAVLGDYGQQYVDELAVAYMAAGDKARLPEIVDGIIGRAGAIIAPPGNAKPVNEVKPANPVRANPTPPRPDRQAGPSPAAKPKASAPLPDPAPQLAEPPKQVTASPPAPPPIVVEPEPVVDDQSKTIIGADEDLTAMLRRLAPDAATPTKN